MFGGQSTRRSGARAKRSVPALAILIWLLPTTPVAAQEAPDRSAKLLALAEKRFGGGLTEADRKLFRETANGKIALYGDGELPPETAEANRIIQADRIRWLCTDPEAVKEVLPHEGVRVQGARIEGRVRLSNARLEFLLSLEQCSMEKGFVLQRAHLFSLFLDGTHSGPINADGLVVKHDLFMQNGFEATGEVRLVAAKIGGTLSCIGGHFTNTEADGYALNANGIEVKGSVFLRNGFRAEGAVDFTGATVGRWFVWGGVDAPKKCTLLKLGSAKIGTLWDEEKSWPQKLALDGLVYDRLYRATLTSGESPVEDKIRSRIDNWIRGNDSEEFLPQPYEQLAKVLQEMGHDEAARQVWIAKEEDPERLNAMTPPGRSRHGVLWATIGYGYRPWQALGWILGFWVVGAALFGCAARDKNGFLYTVKEGTCPQFNALIYSLDTLAPLIDLHQAKYRLPTWGWLRWYLWFHIICGWLLTTLLVAGLSGLAHG